MKIKLILLVFLLSLFTNINCYGYEKVPCIGSINSIVIDGQNFNLNAYNINGYNYFKLRDISYIMNYSNKPFSVKWNNDENSINIISGYDSTSVKPNSEEYKIGNTDAVRTTSAIYVNGQNVVFESYNIEGYTFFKLRDLGEALGFQVDWDNDQNQIIIKTTSENSPITPQQYQSMLGRGMDVDWSKTNSGRENYNEQTVRDFINAGISHVRIRISDDANESLFYYLDKQIEDCISNGLIPIIAYQADEFKNQPNDKNMKKVVEWWGTVAEKYKDVSYLLSFDLLIEATDELNQHPEKLNELYEKLTTEIRKTNPERIIIISPRMRSDSEYLNELKIPTDHNNYLMAEWHFYASGPSKTNERKLWTTGTEEEKKLITDKINYAINWQNKTGVPTWVGAWMAGNYNDGDDYSVEEQIVFAQFITDNLEEAGIPYAVNSDTKFYDREKNEWYKEMIPLRNVIFDTK